MYVELTFPSGLVARVDNDNTWTIVSDAPPFFAELLASLTDRIHFDYAPQPAIKFAHLVIKHWEGDPPKITANTFESEVAPYPDVN